MVNIITIDLTDRLAEEKMHIVGSENPLPRPRGRKGEGWR